ncbi:MAG: HEAT repeat domain-containing protein, partial [Planctomycetota bacterium]|nr:HEAT repeat domain-containing protein [Planctomycetota bacterium]
MSEATAKAMIEVIQTEAGSHDRQKAAMALGLARISTPPAIQALCSMLEDPYPPARASALYALGRSRSRAAAEAVAKALTDSDEMVRVEACLAVGEGKFSDLAEKLPIADPAARVRLAAWQALADLDPKQAAALANQRFAAEEALPVRAEILRCLRRGGAAEGVATVKMALQETDAEVLSEALEWLAAHSRDAAFASEAKKHLASRSALVLRAAIRAYGRLAGAESEEALLALLADKERAADPTVRVTIATALGESGGRRCRPALAALQEDEVREVRRAASAALMQHLRRDPASKGDIETLALQAVRSGKPLP